MKPLHRYRAWSELYADYDERIAAIAQAARLHLQMESRMQMEPY